MEKYHNKDIVFAFYLKIIDLVFKDQIDLALNQLNEYRLAYPEVIGMGVSDNSIIPTDLNRFKQILKTEYLINFLPIDQYKKKRVLSIIAVDYLQSSFVANTHELFIHEFLKSYNILECKPLIDFINDNPTGLFSHCEIDDENELAEMFFHSVINNAYNLVFIKENIEFFLDYTRDGKQYYLGIEISPGDNRCDLCKGQRILRYPFSKLKELPELPMYPGCLCWYTFYTTDD